MIYIRVRNQKGEDAVRLDDRDISFTEGNPNTIQLVAHTFPKKAGKADYTLFQHGSAIVTKAVYERLIETITGFDGNRYIMVDMEKLAKQTIKQLSN